jgi:hypothetical protein
MEHCSIPVPLYTRDDGDDEPARAEQIQGPGSWQLEGQRER